MQTDRKVGVVQNLRLLARGNRHRFGDTIEFGDNYTALVKSLDDLKVSCQ